MGKVVSTMIKKPIQSLTLEHKAHKLIDKSVKPKTAPLHPSSVNLIESYVAENKDLLNKEVFDKNEGLHSRLKGLVVEAPKLGEIQTKQSKKNLPENRSKIEDLEFGYLEPDVVKEGYVSIKQAMEFLSKHFTDPPKYPAENIAKDYKLKVEDVQKILRYFNVFVLQMPKKPDGAEGSLTSFLKPSVLKKLLTDESKKQ